MNSQHLPPAFLPPMNKSMKELDRSFFKKSIALSAFTIFDNKNISLVKQSLQHSGDLLDISPLHRMVEEDDGRKALLLKPDMKAEDPNTWSATVLEMVESQVGRPRSYQLQMNYNHWSMHNILAAILPDLSEDEHSIPGGFAAAGHVAHVNLREQYLPYRYIIGQVLVDKNPNITTVINKTEDVGTESAFRTFPYEVIAGPDDLDVELSESNCTFRFNFGKVYWNTRLATEHGRIVSKFEESEAVCDLMAGVGPFAVPAGKKRVFVWANDLNPDSCAGLRWAILNNKVGDFVNASCEDGRSFIRRATAQLQARQRHVSIQKHKPKSLFRNTLKIPKSLSQNSTNSPASNEDFDTTVVPPSEYFEEPLSFDHYIMNLPATAVEFLDAFWGIYAGREAEFAPVTERQLSMIHVYLFIPRGDSAGGEHEEVCRVVSRHLGAEISPATKDVELWDVRLVSPKKRMYCASFRLPRDVAFAVEPRVLAR